METKKYRIVETLYGSGKVAFKAENCFIVDDQEYWNTLLNYNDSKNEFETYDQALDAINYMKKYKNDNSVVSETIHEIE